MPFHRACSGYGIDTVRLLANVGLPPSLLRTPGITISHVNYARLLNEAARLTGDTLFGLNVGKQIRMANIDTVGLLITHQQEMANIYPFLRYLFSMQMRGSRFRLVRQGGNAFHCVDYLFAEQVDCSQIALVSLAGIHNLFRELLGNNWQPSLVLIRAQPEKDKQALAQYFGCPVELNATMNALKFPASDLELPMGEKVVISRQNKLEMAKSLRRFADLPLLVTHFIEQLLPVSGHNKSRLAACLGVHPRILQECLQQSGTSYAELLRQTRESLACRLLQESNLPVAEIALQLGYGESAAFVRAFQRWQGVTPLRWRKQSKRAPVSTTRH